MTAKFEVSALSVKFLLKLFDCSGYTCRWFGCKIVTKAKFVRIQGAYV